MSLTDNLVAYWRLDEASGNAVDAAGANTLTDTNTVTAAAGKVAGARDFELTNTQYFTHADNAALSTGDIDFTLQLWVNMESKVFFFIQSKDDLASSREYGVFYDNGLDCFSFYVSPDGANVVVVSGTNSGALSAGTWYHIIAWHDAANNQIGIAVNDGTPNTASHTTGVFNGTAPFLLGAVGAAQFPYDGLLDEVALWKRVLTSGERTALYNGGAGVSYDSLAVTGTGATTISHPAVAASGAFAVTGTGAATIGHPSIAATGAFATTGTAALTIGHPTLAGLGAFETTGSGAVVIGHALLAASGTFAVTGSGALTIAHPAVDGVGAFAGAGTGSGAVTITHPAIAGTGDVATTGAGAVTVGHPILTAAGAFLAIVTGSGALVIGPPLVSGQDIRPNAPGAVVAGTMAVGGVAVGVAPSGDVTAGAVEDGRVLVGSAP